MVRLEQVEVFKVRVEQGQELIHCQVDPFLGVRGRGFHLKVRGAMQKWSLKISLSQRVDSSNTQAGGSQDFKGFDGFIYIINTILFFNATFKSTNNHKTLVLPRAKCSPRNHQATVSLEIHILHKFRKNICYFLGTYGFKN